MWSRASPATQQRAQDELNRRKQVYADASPRARRAALVKALSELPDDEGVPAHRARARQAKAQPLTPAERRLLDKAKAHAAEHAAREMPRERPSLKDSDRA